MLGTRTELLTRKHAKGVTQTLHCLCNCKKLGMFALGNYKKLGMFAPGNYKKLGMFAPGNYKKLGMFAPGNYKKLGMFATASFSGNIQRYLGCGLHLTIDKDTINGD